MNHEELKDIELLEDLIAARVNFIKLMKSDEKISQHGLAKVLFFIWKDDQHDRLYNGLHEDWPQI